MDRRIKKERFLSKVVRSPLSYVILFVLIILLSISAIRTYNKSKTAKEKTRQTQSDLMKLQEQENGLKQSLEDMNSSFGVEKSLREKFGIIKEGEKAVIIIEEESEVQAEEETKEKGFFGFIKSFF